jgi:hypothetical protein
MLACILVVLPVALPADGIRGPVAGRLEVPPTGPAETGELAIHEILLAMPTGDTRFFDALEIEIDVPGGAVEIPGMLSLAILTTGSFAERDGIADINGAVIFSLPLTRAGRLAIQVPLRPDAEISASAAVAVAQEPVSEDVLPLAITLTSQMKGVPSSVVDLRFPVAARPVPRQIGAVRLRYRFEDGTDFQTESYLTPEFHLLIDGEQVAVGDEFLLEPGLHRFSLVSERYRDQEVTVGVEQAVQTDVVIPLLPSLATVHYTAPRGSRVWVDGRLLQAANGDFTAPPGEHTIVVVVGDYTVTRRFSVEEGLEYSLSLTMDVVIEEAK